MLFGAGGWMGLPPSPCQCRRARTRLPPAPDTRHAFKTWAGARTSGCGAPEWQSCYDLLAGDLNAAVLPSSSARSLRLLVCLALLAIDHSLTTDSPLLTGASPSSPHLRGRRRTPPGAVLLGTPSPSSSLPLTDLAHSLGASLCSICASPLYTAFLPPCHHAVLTAYVRSNEFY